jgi:hypothetical protein
MPRLLDNGMRPSDELRNFQRSVVGKYWTIEEIRARMYINISEQWAGICGFAHRGVRNEGSRRKSIPDWLPSAHLPSLGASN